MIVIKILDEQRQAVGNLDISNIAWLSSDIEFGNRDTVAVPLYRPTYHPAYVEIEVDGKLWASALLELSSDMSNGPAAHWIKFYPGGIRLPISELPPNAIVTSS